MDGVRCKPSRQDAELGPNRLLAWSIRRGTLDVNCGFFLKHDGQHIMIGDLDGLEGLRQLSMCIGINETANTQLGRFVELLRASINGAQQQCVITWI